MKAAGLILHVVFVLASFVLNVTASTSNRLTLLLNQRHTLGCVNNDAFTYSCTYKVHLNSDAFNY